MRVGTQHPRNLKRLGASIFKGSEVCVSLCVFPEKARSLDASEDPAMSSAIGAS